MQSMGDALKGFDLEAIRERAIKNAKSGSALAEQGEAKYECSDCKDQLGTIVKVEPENEKDTGERWRPCKCIERRRLAKLMQASEITEEFSKKTFGNFDRDNVQDVVRDAFDTAYEYVKAFREIRNSRHNSLALIGRPGCGKTHLLMAAANNLLRKGVGVVYFPWVEGFNEIKGDLDNLDERIHRLQRAEVLYIDDMWKGRGKPTDFQIEQAFALVNYRYLNNLPMMVSSEKSFLEMCEYDEAIGSRLKEMSKGYSVTLVGGIELNYRLMD